MSSVIQGRLKSEDIVFFVKICKNLLLLLLCIPMKLFGTAQIPDLIIYQGDTLSLYYCPLDFYPEENLINPKSLFGSSGCVYTACWRNYVATWEIINDKLYLIAVRNACYPTALRNVSASYKAGVEKDSIGGEFADLKSLFPGRYENGKVRADWVSEKLISPQGRLLYYFHDGFESIYETELEFTFEDGVLLETKSFDNSKTKQSPYTQNSKLLMEFIKNNINYENLPKSGAIKRRVNVSVISSDENGKIDSVKVLRGINESYDKEAIRVVKSIPEWDVIYRHGEKINIMWSIPVYFNLVFNNIIEAE
jgi:hypothetical protein